MGIKDFQNGFGLILVVSLLAGIGTAATAAFIASASRRLSVTVAVVLALITLLPPAIASLKDKLYGADHHAGRWCRAALAQSPPQGLTLVSSDDLAAGLTYLQKVENARPDVAVVIRQHLWDGPYLAEQIQPPIHLPTQTLADFLARPKKAQRTGQAGLLAELIRHNGHRMRWEPAATEQHRTALPLIADTPLFRPRNETVEPRHLGAAIKRVEALLGRASGFLSRRVWARHINACARFAYHCAAGDDKTVKGAKTRWLHMAITALQRPASGPRPYLPALINLGACLALLGETLYGRGDRNTALELYRAAIRWTAKYRRRRPWRRIGWLNEARYRLKIAEIDPTDRDENLDTARKHLRKAEKMGPARAETVFLLGIIAARRGKFGRARHYFKQTLARQPDHRAARLFLERVQRRR